MQFHEHHSRFLWTSSKKPKRIRRGFKTMNESVDYTMNLEKLRRDIRDDEEIVVKDVVPGSGNMGTPPTFKYNSFQKTLALMEGMWCHEGKPFYNVYPIAVELSQNSTLDIPIEALTNFNIDTLLVKFPVGHEPYGIHSVFMMTPSKNVKNGQYRFELAIEMDKGIMQLGLSLESGDKTLQECMTRAIEAYSQRPEWEEYTTEIAMFSFRFLGFIGLLAAGSDLVTPVILSKDRAKFDSLTDEQERLMIINRAARRLGIGADIGREMEAERLASGPHYRKPHPALYWTGEGRKIPRIVFRRGSIVQGRKLKKVPTGYEGEVA